MKLVSGYNTSSFWLNNLPTVIPTPFPSQSQNKGIVQIMIMLFSLMTLVTTLYCLRETCVGMQEPTYPRNDLPLKVPVLLCLDLPAHDRQGLTMTRTLLESSMYRVPSNGTTALPRPCSTSSHLISSLEPICSVSPFHVSPARATLLSSF